MTDPSIGKDNTALEKLSDLSMEDKKDVVEAPVNEIMQSPTEEPVEDESQYPSIIKLSTIVFVLDLAMFLVGQTTPSFLVQFPH